MTNRKITNSNLLTETFTEKELAENIEDLSLMLIIKTQKKLSKKFIDEYILNDKYAIFPEDIIVYSDLKAFQPHYYEHNK